MLPGPPSGPSPGPLPSAVLALAERGPAEAEHVRRLPRLVRELSQEWGLTPDGPHGHRADSLVLPVRRDGERAVLTLRLPGSRDSTVEHEALALRHLAGRGAVRLLAADPHRSALLLERPHRTDLTSLPVLEACGVVAGLYARLHVPAPPRLPSAAAALAELAPRLRGLPRDAPVPRRLVEQAASLAVSLAQDMSGPDGGVVLHGDLHDANVLAGDREPWLVVDPDPLRGDPHAEPAPLLWHRWEEAVASGDLRTALRRRFHTVVDAAGLDEDLARDWVVVRTVGRMVRGLGGPGPVDRDRLTTGVSVCKAVQD